MQTYKPLVALLLLSGCALFKPKPPPVTLRIHEEANESLPEKLVRIVQLPVTDQRVVVDPYPQLTERDLLDARSVSTPGGLAVKLQFDLHGAHTFDEMTTRMRGRYIVVFVDDKPVAAVLVEKRVTNGEFLLETGMTEAETQALVVKLRQITGKKRDFGDTPLAP